MLRMTILLAIFVPFFLNGQIHYYLTFDSTYDEAFLDKKTYKFDSQEEISSFLDKKRSKLIRKGFVLASIDEISWKNDTAFVQFYQGEKFEKINITFDEEDNYIIRKTPRISEKLIAKLPFTPDMVETLLKSVSQYLNNNGYPFSKVYLKMGEITPENSTAHLTIEKGPLVRITKIHIKGESKVREKFVQSGIAIKVGDIYNASSLHNVSSKIQQIKFIKEIRPYEVLFTPDGAEIYLYLESVPVSSINGIVGIQPNATTGKTSVTGEVRLHLLNIAKIGEEFMLNWKSLKPKTQELKINLNFPFLFNTPFGLDGRFNLYKLDTTYMQINARVGVRYYFTGGSFLSVFYDYDNANLLSGSTHLIEGNLSTTKNNSYGLTYVRNQVDYLPNPSKGLNIYAELSAGRRKSTPKDMDTTFRSTTFQGNFTIEAFISVAPRHVFRLANTTRSYYTQSIFENELFRFGGLNVQRGFNEESLYATTMTTFSVEYRFLVDRDSHAFAFFDQSLYENNSKNYIKDYPFGFGVGYSFGTRIGIFSISYALGKQFDNPIRFRDSKLHFGYIAYF